MFKTVDKPNSDLTLLVEGSSDQQFLPSRSTPGALISQTASPRDPQHFLALVPSPKFWTLVSGNLKVSIWNEERDMRPGDTILFQEKTSKNTALRRIQTIDSREQDGQKFKFIELTPGAKVDTIITPKPRKEGSK